MTQRTFLATAAALLLLAGSAMAQPLKVYILAGQSNMVGMASAGTLDHLKLSPDSAAYFKDIFDADGKPVTVDDVYIYSTATANGDAEHGKLAPEWGARGKGARIGPEYAFGLYMHKALGEPILIIKPAWGGKSLCFDFRPPSAGEWTPPPGHPDLVKADPPAPLPLPTELDIPADYAPPDDVLPRYFKGRVGKFMGLRPMRGVEVGKVDGANAIYLVTGPEAEFKDNPFQAGDLIVGVDGQGLRDDAVQHWREAFYGSKSNDWMITVTRWRAGKIETFDFDIAQTLEGGRASIQKVMADAARQHAEYQKYRGHYYRLMMEHIGKVLGDIKAVYPDYDEAKGYELAGFVWFQGWNDMVDAGTYPNRNKPRGYEQYSWLLTHFIQDVRKELKTPDLPFVIGVMGVGGVIDDPEGNNQHYFRRAMAAPADDPQFAGTVAAVYTEKYFDAQLDALATRSYHVGLYRNVLEMRDGLTGDALNQAYAAYRAQYFTPEEERILKVGKSNAGFHYNGSGKFMAGAGRGFADAMLELHKHAE